MLDSAPCFATTLSLSLSALTSRFIAVLVQVILPFLGLCVALFFLKDGTYPPPRERERGDTGKREWKRGDRAEEGRRAGRGERRGRKGGMGIYMLLTRLIGHRNVERHNQGDTNSVFTSWSTNKETALIHMGERY